VSGPLRLWVVPAGARSPRRALEEVLQGFPGPAVEVRVLPAGAAWDRLMAVAKGRHGAPPPDVVHIDARWTGTLVRLGLLADLASFLREEERGDIPPALWDLCHGPHTRHPFAVPWTLDLRLPRLRREAFARAGLSVPELATWDALTFLLARPRLIRAAGGPEEDSLLTALAPWVWGAGGDGEDLLSPASLAGAAFARSFLVDGPAAGLGLAPLGPADPAWVPLPPPAGPAGRAAVLGGGALAVWAGTERPDESRALLRRLCAPDARSAVAAALGVLPPGLAAAEEALPAPARPLFRDAQAFARPFRPAVTLGSFERLVQRCLAPALRAAAPWDAWHAALREAAAEAAILHASYEPASV
jgi:ABC-type glycerol-3-phosphate transport system substrate-binding protein